MTFSNLPVRLHRAKPAPFQLRADHANGISLLSDLRQPNEQGVCEFVADLVAVNVGHGNFRSAGAIKVFDELRSLRFCSIACVAEAPQRAVRFSANLFAQPGERFKAIGFSQQPARRDAMNPPLRPGSVGGQLCRLALEPGQSPVLCRRFPILFWADNPSSQVEAFGNQCSVAQPDAIASAEFAAHGRDFQLKLAVVMPGPLNSRAVYQTAFAEQLASFIPLPADAVKQSGSVWFFAGENSILMPGADGAVPATLSQGHLLAELTVSIILALNSAAHARISRGTGALRRQSRCSYVTSCDSENWSRERFLARLVHQRNCGSAGRPATVLDDEDLPARALAVAGASEEERRRARLSDRAVVSLTLPTLPYNRPGSHCAVMASLGTRASEVSPPGLAHRRSGA